MFMGEYSHTIDTKGRLIVPSKFREQLGNEFVVTKGLDGCLFVYANEEWKNIEEKFRRILLPQVLREFADLSKDVVLVGVLSRIEIWSKERWQDTNSYEDMDEVAEHMAELGLSI